MIKKKLLVLGLIAVMALGHSGSVFAAEGTYYVSKLAYNSDYGMITGSVSYTPTNSNSKSLGDTIQLNCLVAGVKTPYSKTTYGVNATSTTLSRSMGDFIGTPSFGYNIGLVKNESTYVYEQFKRTVTTF